MMDDLRKQLVGVQEGVPLAPYTTFKIGGLAKYFFVARSAEEMTRALGVAVEFGMPYFILAGGSNILVSDKGFEGLVIQDASTRFVIDGVRVVAETGVILDQFISALIEQGFAGLEKMSGVPGTVGGAIRGNAGAYGQEIKDRLCSVQVARVPAAGHAVEVFRIDNEGCGFKYRESIFKRSPNLIVLESEFEFDTGDRGALKRVREKILAERRVRYPSQPSCGSTFKNIKFEMRDGRAYVKDTNQEIPPEIVRKLPEHCIKWGTLPAGWLTVELGLLGIKMGDSMISSEHGNFIINMGNAKAADIVALVSLVKQKARDIYGLQLEEEVQFVGF